MLPLTGIKVLDFTHLLPGEVCVAILSDMGAEVVRIEAPTPGLAHKLEPIVDGESLFYWSMQRDKTRLKVDLKNPEGVALVKKLVAEADVVTENFRTGVMDRLGLGFNDLRAINPKLIYLSITGYGKNSELQDTPVHDLNLCAEAGILSLNRRENERPVIPALPISDYMAGMLATLSVMAALVEVRSGGEGRALDISMADAAISAMNVLGSIVLYTGKTPQDGGFSYPKEYPNYNVYECKDGGYLAVACLERPFWRTFCKVIGRADLEGAIDNPAEHGGLIATLTQLIKTRTRDEWGAVFHGTKCCVSPVNSINEAFQKYPLKDRGMIADLPHPTLGNIPQILFPVDKQLRRTSWQDSSKSSFSELIGLLNKSGYSSDEIDKLVQRKIISLPAEATTSGVSSSR